MKKPDRDGEIFRRYQSGDGDALRELLELYGANLILFINRYVNNLSVSEELMEDTFCEIAVNPLKFRGGCSVKTYLFTIAKNKAIDHIRRQSKYGFVPIEDVSHELYELGRLEDRVIKDENQRELMRAMSEIPEEYRTVLHLFYFEELPYNDIARIMNKTVKQIGNLAHRARLSLKGELERRGFVYEEL